MKPDTIAISPDRPAAGHLAELNLHRDESCGRRHTIIPAF